VKKKTKFTLVHTNFPVPARRKPTLASRSRANVTVRDRSDGKGRRAQSSVGPVLRIGHGNEDSNTSNGGAQTSDPNAVKKRNSCSSTSTTPFPRVGHLMTRSVWEPTGAIGIGRIEGDAELVLPSVLRKDTVSPYFAPCCSPYEHAFSEFWPFFAENRPFFAEKREANTENRPIISETLRLLMPVNPSDIYRNTINIAQG